MLLTFPGTVFPLIPLLLYHSHVSGFLAASYYQFPDFPSSQLNHSLEKHGQGKSPSDAELQAHLEMYSALYCYC